MEEETLLTVPGFLIYKNAFIITRKAEPLGDIRGSSCREEDVGRLCTSVVRAVDRQLKDLGSSPSAVESVFFSQKDLFHKEHV